MKKTTFITAIVAFMMMAVTPAFAQEENGYKKFNVRDDFTENAFQWFHDAELLAAGDKEKSNAQTIHSVPGPMCILICFLVCHHYTI